jgi:hypothetical protein
MTSGECKDDVTIRKNNNHSFNFLLNILAYGLWQRELMIPFASLSLSLSLSLACDRDIAALLSELVRNNEIFHRNSTTPFDEA